jgi:hypothetical protein
MSKKNKAERRAEKKAQAPEVVGFAPLTAGCLKCEDQGPHDGEHVFPAVTEETPTRTFVVEDYTEQPQPQTTATEVAPAAPVATPTEAPAPAPVAAPATPKVPRTGKSTMEKPTRAVWTIADEMKRADPNVTRKQIVDECMRRGIAYFTARTQAQLWSKKQG